VQLRNVPIRQRFAHRNSTDRKRGDVHTPGCFFCRRRPDAGPNPERSCRGLRHLQRSSAKTLAFSSSLQFSETTTRKRPGPTAENKKLAEGLIRPPAKFLQRTLAARTNRADTLPPRSAKRRRSPTEQAKTANNRGRVPVIAAVARIHWTQPGQARGSRHRRIFSVGPQVDPTRGHGTGLAQPSCLQGTIIKAESFPSRKSDGRGSGPPGEYETMPLQRSR